MDRRPGEASAPPRAWPFVGAAALLVGVNLLNNVVASGPYLLWAALGVTGLVLLARADGLRRQQWGLGRVRRRSALAAFALAATTAVVMLLGTQLPGISAAYSDQRAAGMSAAEVVFAAVVRAPLGTALLEELAFRGVLLAMLSRRISTAWAVVCSSVAFGAWHVVPSLGIASGNAAVGSALGGHLLLASAAAVVASALAGAFLCLLRIRYDHLAVPLAVHATANSLGYLLAWLVTGP